jgi:quercetin dioxygenase-like cupin family protein
LTAVALASANGGRQEVRGRGLRLAAFGVVALLAVPLLLVIGLLGWAQWEVHKMTAEGKLSPRPELEQASSTPLLDLPGHRVTAVLVKFPPGAHAPEHHHEATVYVFVLAGAVRSAVSNQAPGVFTIGQSFEEPLGSVHLYADNASATDPAVALAIFVHREGAQLTVFH